LLGEEKGRWAAETILWPITLITAYVSVADHSLLICFMLHVACHHRITALNTSMESLNSSRRRKSSQFISLSTIVMAHADLSACCILCEPVVRCQLTRIGLSVVVSSSGSASVSINEVNLRRARLVVGWVTVSWLNFRCRTSICNQSPRPTQPGHPFVGRCSEYQPKGGDALRLGSKVRYDSCVSGR